MLHCYLLAGSFCELSDRGTLLKCLTGQCVHVKYLKHPSTFTSKADASLEFLKSAIRRRVVVEEPISSPPQPRNKLQSTINSFAFKHAFDYHSKTKSSQKSNYSTDVQNSLISPGMFSHPYPSYFWCEASLPRVRDTGAHS